MSDERTNDHRESRNGLASGASDISTTSKVVRFPRAVPPTAPKPAKKRPRNTMPDGRKRVRLTVGTKPDGKPDIRNFTASTLTEAKAKRDAFLAQLEAERAGIVPSPIIRPELDPNQPLSRFADYWDAIYPHGRERAQINIASIVRKISASPLGQMPLSAIRQVDVQAFAQACVYSKSHTTKIKNALNNIFDAAIDNGIIDRTPCAKVVWSDYGQKGHRAIEQWERDLILNNWSVHPAGIGAMVMLFSGARPEEARALNYSNVTDKFVLIRDSSYFNNSGDMILKPGETKTLSGQRDIPLMPQLREMISFLSPSDSGLIWIDSKGAMLTQSTYRHNWDAFLNALRCIKIGVPKNKAGNYSGIRIDCLTEKERAMWDSTLDITPYSLRHTFCTMLFEACLDLERIRYLMGHNRIDTTLNFYKHWSAMMADRSDERMTQYFSTFGARPEDTSGI